MTERFENRLNKDNVKFNTLNPVWDNEKQDALNVFEMIDMLNHLYEEKQIAIRLAKSNQGKKTRLKNYLKFEYGVSDEKLMEIMTDDKWLGEYDDDGNLVMYE